jgi:nucleotidyltransferase substrate binding protein (TIGR01987 family)
MDTRWKQRFNNFIKAYQELGEAACLSRSRALTRLEQQGVIQGFEYTHELAWNVLKDYLEEYGHIGLIGSKDTTREAFKRGLLKNGEIWMEMIKSRNLTSHTYNRDLALAILTDILEKYYPLFEEFTKNFTKIYNEE